MQTTILAITLVLMAVIALIFLRVVGAVNADTPNPWLTSFVCKLKTTIFPTGISLVSISQDHCSPVALT